VYDIIFKEEVALKICSKNDAVRMAMHKKEAAMNRALKEKHLDIDGYVHLSA
jgi:hypothetical protein